jgi:hypothetical protein
MPEEQIMGHRWMMIALMLSSASLPGPSQDSHQSTATDPEIVSGSGCVRKAVEMGCGLVLTDAETKAHFNLFFSGNEPRPGTAIRFSGVSARNQLSYCMQGKIVKVKEWSQLDMKCPTAGSQP